MKKENKLKIKKFNQIIIEKKIEFSNPIDNTDNTKDTINLKMELQELLTSYKTKLNFIKQYKIDNNMTNTIDIEKYSNDDYKAIMKMNKKQLIYNYNCGVLNHTLGNLVEAIEYYEEAAYLKFKPAQKALGYCYKHGIGYQQSDEISELWYKASQNNENTTTISTIENID